MTRVAQVIVLAAAGLASSGAAYAGAVPPVLSLGRHCRCRGGLGPSRHGRGYGIFIKRRKR
jgi:hypothetical protein